MTDLGHPSSETPPVESATRVTVDLPVDPARLPLLRGIAAAVAVSLDFDIDTMADLRMAVDELASTVFSRARADGLVRVEFAAEDHAVAVRAHADAADATPIDQSSFGWMVLTTLGDQVTGTVGGVDSSGPKVEVSLRVRRAQANR